MKPLNQYLLEEPERLTKYKNSLRLNILWKVLTVLIVVTLTSIILATFTGLLRTKTEDNQNLPKNLPEIKRKDEIIIKNIQENDQQTKRPKYTVIQWFEKHQNELIDIDIDPKLTNKIKKYEKEINKILPVLDEASHENKFITNSLLKKLRSKRDTRDQMNSFDQQDLDIDPLALSFTEDMLSKVRDKRGEAKMIEFENALQRCKKETKNQQDCMPLFKEVYEYFQIVSTTMEKVKTLLKEVETYELHSMNNNETKVDNENQLKINNNTEMKPIENTLIKPVAFLPIKPIENKTYPPLKPTEKVTNSPIAPDENKTYSPIAPIENTTYSPIAPIENTTYSPIAPHENKTNSPISPTESLTNSPNNTNENKTTDLPKIDNYSKTTQRNFNTKNLYSMDHNDDNTKTAIQFKIKDKPMKFSLFDNIELTTVKESLNLSELINFYRAVPKSDIQVTVPPTVYKTTPKIKILDGKIPKTKCITQKIPIKDQYVDILAKDSNHAYTNNVENPLFDSKIEDVEQNFAYSDVLNLPLEAFKNHPHIHEDVIGDYSQLSYRVWDSDNSYGHDEENLGQKWYNLLHDQSELHNQMIDDSILDDDLPEFRAHAVNMKFDRNFQALQKNSSYIPPVDDITSMDLDIKPEQRAHSIDMNFDTNFRGLENNTVHLMPVQPIEIPSSNLNVGSFTSQPPVAPAATTAKSQMNPGFFPVTGETIKATAQFVMNPSFGIPSMPFCFAANPANYKTYYQPLIMPSPIQIPPTYGQFVHPAYYMIPPNQQGYGMHMPGVSVGPFGSTTAAGNIANHNLQHYKPPTMPGVQPFNPQQQVFCSYMPNSNSPNPPNPFFRNKMESLLTSVHSIKNENEYPNIPQNTDIIYGSFINQITSQSLEGRNSEQGDSNNHCDSNSIACYSTHQCIPKANWCDNKVDCTDASDESACSCKSRLHKSRLCDGYPDCPMGEDELGCFGCDKLMYSCYNNVKEYLNSGNSSVSMCYSSINRCDGDKNCLNGNDEKECNALLSDIGGGKNTLQPRAFTEGFLHHNFKGKWYPVCGNNSMNWAIEACENEMGKLDEPPQIYTEYGNIPGPFLHSNSYNHEPLLMQNCEQNGQSVHIRVKCPPLKCGLTKLSNSTTRNKKSTDTETADDSNITEKFKRNDLRIVGGEFCDSLQWPFIVGIFRDGKFHCGGIIYNSEWIITAAHCFVQHEQYHFEVQAGLLRRRSYSSNVQKSKVLYAIVHNDYEHKTMKHDLALLNLEKPLKYNRWVRPICLPDKGKSGVNDFDWIFGPKPGTLCTAVGWGAIREKGPSSDHLREVTIPILKSCLEKDDNQVYSLCAGENDGGRDACQGDSGGPLFCPSETNDNEWYLAGVVSHGNGCARAGEPGVYTRIALYKKWIEKWINNFNSMPKPQKLKQDCPGYYCMWGGGKCIQNKRRCDRYVDCLGGEDEVGCQYPADMVGNIQDITRRPEFDVDESTDSPLNQNRNDNEESQQNISTVSDLITKFVFTNNQSQKIHSTTPMNEIENSSTTTNTPEATSEFNIESATTETSSTNTETTKNQITKTPTTENATTKAATTEATTTKIGTTEFSTTNTKTTVSATTIPQTTTTETITATTETASFHNTTTKPVIDSIQKLTTKEMLKIETTTTANSIPETTLQILTQTTTNHNGSSTTKVTLDDFKFLDITTISNEFSSPSITELLDEFSTTVLVSSADPEKFLSTTETNFETTTIKKNISSAQFGIQNDQPFSNSTPTSQVIDVKKLQNGVKPIVPGLTKFRCKRIPQLIDMSTRCDRIVDCEDGSDEQNCTCRDYLTANFNSLICDGKPDCEDLSDEKNCEKCTSDQFLCPLSRTCIPKSKRCDEKIDCDFREDELDCFALTDGKNVLLDSNRRPQLNPFGFFTRNKNGDWRLMCSYETNFNENNLNNTDSICKMLGFKGSKTSHTTNPFTNDSIFRTLDNEVNSIDEDMIEKISVLEIISKFGDKEQSYNKQPSYRIPKSLESEKRCNSLFIECSQYSNSQKPFVEIELSTNVLNDDFKHLEPIINPYQKPFAIVKPNISSLIEITNKMDEKDVLKNLTEFSLNKFEFNSTTDIFNQSSDSSINLKNYHYPWSVQLFANGVFQCNGVLLNKHWVGVPAKCYITWSLEKDFVIALFGGYKTHQGHKGPYEQIRKINCMKIVGTKILLLHLENPIKFSRHVLPTFLPTMNNDHDYIFEDSTKNHYNVCMSVTYDKLDKIKTFIVEQTLCDDDDSNEEDDSEELDPPKLCLKGIFNNTNENYKDLNLCSTAQNEGLQILNDSSVYVPLYRHRYQHHHGIIMCQDDTKSGWYPISFYSKNSKKMCKNHGNNNNKSPASLYSYLEIEPLCPEIYKDILKEIEKPDCEVYYPLPMLDCSTGGFRCPLGNCLPEEKVCDSKPDCYDGSDENTEFCNARKKCNPDELKCHNGNCVPKAKFCDHYDDCGDLTDEPTVCSCLTYLRATDPQKICDGDRNCLDKSDESPAICNCTKNSYRCESSGECIPKDFVCDGDPDCPYNEDEQFCYGLEYPAVPHPLNDGFGQLIQQNFGIWYTKCFPRDKPLPTEDDIKEICKKLGFDNEYEKPKFRIVAEDFNDNSTSQRNIQQETTFTITENGQNVTRTYLKIINGTAIPINFKDEFVKMNDSIWSKRYLDSTKFVLVNKFSPIRLNDNLTIPLKPSRPIGKLVKWNKNDTMNCYRMEIKCQ